MLLAHLFTLSVALTAIQAYNILLIAPTPIVGQWLFFEEILKELLSRGHKVSAISNYNSRAPHENYTGITISAFDIQKYCEF